MTQNPQSAGDDALYFLNSSQGPDLFDASEDPNGKSGGKTPAQFRHDRISRTPSRSTITSLTPGPVLNLTPGARRIP
jgi:hypothetical protein